MRKDLGKQPAAFPMPVLMAPPMVLRVQKSKGNVISYKF